MSTVCECFTLEQAVYKIGFSTIDNISALQSLSQKYRSKPNIDFSKAYDKV